MNYEIGKVYILFYKGKKQIKDMHSLVLRSVDELVRFGTGGGNYSHCELGIYLGNGNFECYSASFRDGGVRKKIICPKQQNWDIRTARTTEENLIAYYEKTKGKPYDLQGAIGVVIPFLHADEERYFCSEWCFNVEYGFYNGYIFSPNKLAALYIPI